MHSRIPVGPAVQRIIEAARKAWQLNEQSVCVACWQRATNRCERIETPPQDSLQALAALALQAEIWVMRKTVMTVG